MTDINKKILDTIKDDLRGRSVPEEDATAIGLIRASFKGTFRYTMMVVVALQVIFAGLGIYCAYQMFGSTVTNLKIEWLGGAIVAFLAFAIARLWFFMELNRLSVLREIKRVEMLVAFLSETTRESQPT